MATYAIGDVQGCFASLQKLLAKLAFDPKRDRLWLVGDLVNRGPQNVEVLRWARGLGDRLVAVLGNHDLHLIARFHGAAKEKRRDTLQDVLAAPDAAQLVDWLAARPFLHHAEGWVMVHAGLFPEWTLADAQGWAERAGKALRSAPGPFLSGLRGQQRLSWTQAQGEDDEVRIATAVAALTRMRMLKDGAMVPDFDGHPKDGPKGARSWFELARRVKAPVVCGHWSALGLALNPGACVLDTGCVWGRQLTALRLEDRAVFAVDAVEPASSESE